MFLRCMNTMVYVKIQVRNRFQSQGSTFLLLVMGTSNSICIRPSMFNLSRNKFQCVFIFFRLNPTVLNVLYCIQVNFPHMLFNLSLNKCTVFFVFFRLNPPSWKLLHYRQLNIPWGNFLVVSTRVSFVGSMYRIQNVYRLLRLVFS